MKRIIKRIIVGVLTVGFLFSGFSPVAKNVSAAGAPEGFVSPYEKYGDLKVANDVDTGYKQLCDKDGNPVQLKGINVDLLSEDDAFFIDSYSIDTYVYDWKIDVIRVSIDPYGQFFKNNQNFIISTLDSFMEYSKKLGVYVIFNIENNSGYDDLDDLRNYPCFESFINENSGLSELQIIYGYLSQKYGDNGNVLFDATDFQDAAEAINSCDKDNIPNIIIWGNVNNETYTVDNLYTNQVVYSVQLKTGSDEFDDEVLKTKIDDALESRMAVICTSWNTANADDTTGPYINNAEKWLGYFAEKKISWCYSGSSMNNDISSLFKNTCGFPSDSDNDGIPTWDYSTSDSNPDLTYSGVYVRAKLRGDELPQFGNELLLYNFQSGGVPCARINDKNQTIGGYDFSIQSISEDNKALYLGALDTEGDGAFGDKGVRLRFSTNANYTPYRRVTFKVYIVNTDSLVDGKLNLYPVLVSPKLNWWGQTTAVTLTADDFSEDPDSGLLVAYVDSDYTHILRDGTDTLDNMVLLIGDTNGFYIDDVAFTTRYNGDYEDRPLPPYNAGTFNGFPMTFENGSRETWRPDGNVKMDHTTITIEEVAEGDHALSFPVKFRPTGNLVLGARLKTDEGLFDDSVSVNYDALAMNIYLEKNKASEGTIELNVFSVPDVYPYWYVSEVGSIDPVNDGTEVTTPDGKNLLKYSLYVPLNGEKNDYGENPYSSGHLRNIVLGLYSENSNYNGRVYFDNIRYVDAQNLDNIDKVYNYNQHADILLPLAAKEGGKVHHAEEAILVIEDALFTPEILERNDVSVVDILENLNSINNNTLADIMQLYKNINEAKILNDDPNAYKDVVKMKDICKDLGASDDQIDNMIDPVVEALLKEVGELKDDNAALSDQIDDKKQELQNKNDRLDEIQNEVDNKTDDLKKLNDEAEKTAKDIDKLKKDIKKLEEEKAELDAKIAEQEALIKKLQDDAGSSETPDKPGTTDKSEVTLKVGDEVVVGKGIYKITAADEVTFTGPTSSKLKSFTIDSTVKLIDGKEYKVTAIAANAFKANKKLAKVTIGENVASIGKNAFNGCKKLKTINVKTELLTSKNVGAGAFKGIKKKATFKVPKSMKKAYKKLFTKKGAKKPKVK